MPYRWISALALTALAGLAMADDVSRGLKLPVDDRTDIGLTIYNNFAVVRDTRETVLPEGLLEIEFENVATQIDPLSVRVQSLNDDAVFRILEQSYRYDLLNRQSLLERYIGRKLKYARSVLDGTNYERMLREGTLLSISPEIVQFGDVIEVSPEGVISLPYIPDGLRTIPTLVWLAENRESGEKTIETSYLTSGISWEADYTLTLNERENRVSLSSWVNVTNQSGSTFDNAHVTLVAGDVNRSAPQPKYQRQVASYPMAEMARDSSGGIAVAALSDYHLYTLPRRVSLESKEQHQFRWLDVDDLKVEKRYELTTWLGGHMAEPSEANFDIVYELENGKRKPGVPLPAGKVRVMKPNDSVLQFLGEARMPHVPVGESASLSIGKAFDIVAEHRQTAMRRLGERGMEFGYEVTVRNRKDEKVTVILNQKASGDWTVLDQTASGKRADATTQVYELSIPANSERSFSFTFRQNR